MGDRRIGRAHCQAEPPSSRLSGWPDDRITGHSATLVSPVSGRIRTVFVAIAALALAALSLACKSDERALQYESLDRNATALRDRFNGDFGTVRVVMLVAPS